MSKIALITGVTGQDGSYFAEFLLVLGYLVHGAVRRTGLLARSRLPHLFTDPAICNQRLFLHSADCDDRSTLQRVLARVAPDEITKVSGHRIRCAAGYWGSLRCAV